MLLGRRMLDEVKGYAVRCDACDEIGPVVQWSIGMTDSLADVARARATAVGWRRIEGCDFCPECARKVS